MIPSSLRWAWAQLVASKRKSIPYQNCHSGTCGLDCLSPFPYLLTYLRGHHDTLGSCALIVLILNYLFPSLSLASHVWMV